MQQQPHKGGKTLWEVLGLELPDNTEQLCVARRVVIVGDTLSGKRTLANLLLTAAMQQLPSSSPPFSLLSFGASNSSNTGDHCFLRHVRQEGADIGVGGGGFHAASQRMSTSSSSSLSVGLTPLMDGLAPDCCVPHLSCGAGIAHAFIPQRIPTRRAAFPAATNGGFYSSRPGDLSGNGRRVMTEFFCCDAPGALTMALPTVEALETSVVLLVVDTSVPWRVQDQLRRWYGHLNAHVVRTLGAELPKQDEVRRMRMIERQQCFWHAQQQALEAVRRRWCEREGIEMPQCNSGEKTTLLPELRVPKSGVSPLCTILVCTKTDQLEKLSREAEKMTGRDFSAVSCNMTSSTSGNSSNTVSWASSSLLSALRSTGLTLLDLMSQLLRKEAIERQSAIVGVGGRLNTIATPVSSSSRRATIATPLPSDSGGDRAYDGAAASEPPTGSHEVFVHPFYKGLWSYIFQLLHEPVTTERRDSVMAVRNLFRRDASEANGSNVNDGVPVPATNAEGGSSTPGEEQNLFSTPLLDEIEAQLSTQFQSHAFLPHGVDHLELLSPFVTSTEAVTLENIFASGTGDVEEGQNGLLRLHENYMQQIESALATACPVEEVMIWENL